MRKRRFPVILLAVSAAAFAIFAEENPVPLTQAHAHNDYAHKRPLLDALDHGFCSIEADVHLVDGRLLVAHDAREVDPARTLQSLYLDPLRERVTKNGGKVYPNGPEVTLLIDFKGEPEKTYAALRELLKPYADILTKFTPTSTEKKAITVLISGSRPTDTMAKEDVRYAALDGRWSDLDGPASPHLMPLISDHWPTLFPWYGRTPMPDDLRRKLRDAVGKAHKNGCKIRFWATPPREEVWQEELDAGVDLLNADNLDLLQAFLLKTLRKAN